MPCYSRSRSVPGRSHRKTDLMLQSASLSLGFMLILYASIMFWNTFILQPQITSMKTNLYTLKETVNNIGVAYDNLSKDIKYLNGAEPVLNEAEVNDILINDDDDLTSLNESKTSNENTNNIKKIDKKTQKSLNTLDSENASYKQRDSLKRSDSKMLSSNTKNKRGSPPKDARNKYPTYKTIDENFETSFYDSKNYKSHTTPNTNTRNQTSYCNTMGELIEAGTFTENCTPERKVLKKSQFESFKEAIGLQPTDPFWNDMEFWFKEHQKKHKRVIVKSDPKPEHFKSKPKKSSRQASHVNRHRYTIPSMIPYNF